MDGQRPTARDGGEEPHRLKEKTNKTSKGLLRILAKKFVRRLIKNEKRI